MPMMFNPLQKALSKAVTLAARRPALLFMLYHKTERAHSSVLAILLRAPLIVLV